MTPCRLARTSCWTPSARTALVLRLALLLPRPQAHAGSDFSTGVSDDRLSLPEGPGSLEGLGDLASPRSPVQP